MPTEISPWIERLKAHRLALGTGLLLVVLAAALTWVAWRWGIAEDRMAMLQKQADAGFLQPPSTNRTVRLDLRAPASIAVGGGAFPERVDLRLNTRSNRHTRFRLSLLREDGTLVLHADHLVRDSNFDLRFSFNTSVLPAGQYVLRVEGHGRSGRLEPIATVAVRAAGR